MLPRHTQFAAMLALCLAAGALPAWGLSETTQVTPLTADAWPLMLMQFQVKMDKQADGMHVTVTIVPHEGVKLFPHVEGHLAIMDGATPVATVPVAVTRTEKAVTCAFVVAEKYLEKSTFTFAQIGTDMEHYGNYYYWFYLGDFAK